MIITLTTDFGTSSPYVAAMKAAILTVSPTASLVDITHSIAPQNVHQAAVVLADIAPVFPPGTLHVAVIDPGVGTQRKIIYVEVGEQRFLAPDNGLLSYLARSSPPRVVIELTESQFWRSQVSNTFHGRDIFAPVAGHLATGVSPHSLGVPADRMIQIGWPQPQYGDTEVIAEVLYVDSFGNVITNVPLSSLKSWLGGRMLWIAIADRQVCGLKSTYGLGKAGELIALGDSQGRLELAVVNGSAAAALGIQVGAQVRIQRSPSQREQS